MSIIFRSEITLIILSGAVIALVAAVSEEPRDDRTLSIAGVVGFVFLSSFLAFVITLIWWAPTP